MAHFVQVAGVEELPPGTGTSVTVAGKDARARSIHYLQEAI